MVHGRITIATSLLLVLGISTAFASTKAPEAVPGEYIVKVKDANLFRKSMMGALSTESIRPVIKKQNLYLVKRNILEKSDFAISQLRSANVEFVEPNYIFHVNKTPDDPMYSELWGMHNVGQKAGRAGVDINAEKAWDVTTGSKDVLVAVIDTGIDYTHPDIAPNAWTNQAEANGKAQVDDDKNGFVDDIHGYNFCDDKGDPMDDHGHGTHVSGTIGAKGNDGKGIVGVNWDVTIMGVKFLDAGGSGTLENAVKAIDYATQMGAMIESNSWGGGGVSEALKQAIERARDKNVLFVAAAGNESNDNDTNPAYPASYDVDNVVAVAAIDRTGNMADFSNYGTHTVHLAAPGVDVYSSLFGNKYDAWSGTSMATPHVSGVAALIKSANMAFGYKEIKQRLISSARPLASIRGRVVTSGVVDAYYAVSGQTPPPDPEDPANWQTVAQPLSSPHPYTEKSAKAYKVTVRGAKAVSLYFDRFEVEKNYDVVSFSDAQGNVIATWTGTHNGEFAPAVPGDTVNISFTSDDTINGYGFDVSKAAYK